MLSPHQLPYQSMAMYKHFLENRSIVKMEFAMGFEYQWHGETKPLKEWF